MTNQKEPTRPLPAPTADTNGNLFGESTLSPKSLRTRAGMAVPSTKVIPVIFVPGIMGSNLRANTKAGNPMNKELNPGEQAWRPPNGKVDGLSEASKWKARSPAVRQRILDPNTLEVDPSGEISLPVGNDGSYPDIDTARSRGWGEIHSDSYGEVLKALQHNLNRTFRMVSDVPYVETFWINLNRFDRARWGGKDNTPTQEITEQELKKIGQFQYPVNAFGYNWLQSNERSAENLKARIESIIAEWKGKKHQCDQVLIVTHSMGGLVARACAKQIPQKIAGVIHGVMPTFGAPVCYRRVACGTEKSSPGKGKLDLIAMEKFAEIAGASTEETTPVLALASGPLELLPTHLYPSPWLFAEVKFDGGKLIKNTPLNIPSGNPYLLYRDFKLWYRAINPDLADPSGKNLEGTKNKIIAAVIQAEKFHRQSLGSYFHPNTFAFYCADICLWPQMVRLE